jgi:hypothetical protein
MRSETVSPSASLATPSGIATLAGFIRRPERQGSYTAWLELHQSLPTHRKTLIMADALDVKPVQIVGHLTCLWLWALDNAQDGVLHVSPQMIARAAQWEDEALPYQPYRTNRTNLFHS